MSNTIQKAPKKKLSVTPLERNINDLEEMFTEAQSWYLFAQASVVESNQLLNRTIDQIKSQKMMTILQIVEEKSKDE